MHPQAQKKVARAYRIDGAIVLYRSAVRNQFKGERSLARAEPWWTAVFRIPLFLRTLLHLIFVCRHRHRGPPMTLREPIPSNPPGCRSAQSPETYITCLDCGRKFAFNHMTRQLVDFWGVHDTEELARVRRRVNKFFSPLGGLVARAGKPTMNTRIPMSRLAGFVRRLGIRTKEQWSKLRRRIASKWAPRSTLKQRHTRPGNN
jgi:hypothetical protein